MADAAPGTLSAPVTGALTPVVGAGFADVSPERWNKAAGDAQPFVRHEFFAALEQSASVGSNSGWQPLPLSVGAGYAPLWGKGHSQGEYVFDHGWADSWHHAGGRYYPKLVIAVPFTPVPGPRLLGDDDAARRMIAATEDLTRANGLSSAHALFLDGRDRALFAEAGWLLREGVQFHWRNPGYRDFYDFLDGLTARKRKALRRERADALLGLDVRRLSGSAITTRDWDSFWTFYQDTGARKWGTPYLTRDFFTRIAASMGEDILLILAERRGVPIAGALHFFGSDRLFGRYWGATEHVPFLHFELCYYQAMDVAIERGLAWVEAGAQGEHKLARGYTPEATWSAHYIAHAGFRAAVAAFLEQERQAIAEDRTVLQTLLPFRADKAAGGGADGAD